MANWQNKLDTTIEALEAQSGQLSNAVTLYDSINKLQNDLTDSYLDFEESKTDFKEASQQLKNELSGFKTQINNIKQTSADELEKFNKSTTDFQERFIKDISKLEQLINSKIDEVNKSTIDFSNKLEQLIDSKIDEVNDITQKNNDLLESGIQKKIQELYQDNKNFQKELDASLITRLEKHKSNIQVELRNEGAQIQRGFETTLNSNFNSMDSTLKERFEIQSKQLNTLKILIFVVVVIGISLAIGLYLK